MEEAFFSIYATITGEEPIPDWGGEEGVGPAVWPLNLRAEGRELESWGAQMEWERLDSHTVQLTQRCPVMTVLPAVVELEVYTDQLVPQVRGNWWWIKPPPMERVWWRSRTCPVRWTDSVSLWRRWQWLPPGEGWC